MSIYMSPTGWHALYQNKGGTNTFKPVQRFNDDGAPMVIQESGLLAGLVPAADLPNHDDTLKRLIGLEQTAYYHSAIPAAPGWRVQVKRGDRFRIDPVAAWIFDQDGSLTPVSENEGHQMAASGDLASTILAPGEPDHKGFTS